VYVVMGGVLEPKVWSLDLKLVSYSPKVYDDNLHSVISM
jgi:hypothetical protein